MRIAYIAPYQGPGLLNRRPTLLNLGLAANVKMELVAELLQSQGNSVEILSQGEVVEQRFKLYPAFREEQPVGPAAAVHYAPALPVRFVNGLSSALWTLRLFQRQQRRTPYDVVIIYNLKLAQVFCALYAMRRGLPVILEYEDDALVDVGGKSGADATGERFLRLTRKVLNSVSGCIGVSPFILTRVPANIPRMLLRGIVSENILQLSKDTSIRRKKWVVFSGTHFRTKGLEPLLKAWEMLDLPDWELHIAGHGERTHILKKMSEHNKNIVFHGLLNREENARLLTTAMIGMNPHELSATPGNIFAFKIIECLAAGLHVLTTPMGALEEELEAGVTYMADNSPETIAATIRRVIQQREYERIATDAAQEIYGPAAVARCLERLLNQVRSTHRPSPPNRLFAGRLRRHPRG
jgi:glycosyltransferase involved in cell wall biosynthesis